MRSSAFSLLLVAILGLANLSLSQTFFSQHQYDVTVPKIQDNSVGADVAMVEGVPVEGTFKQNGEVLVYTFQVNDPEASILIAFQGSPRVTALLCGRYHGTCDNRRKMTLAVNSTTFIDQRQDIFGYEDDGSFEISVGGVTDAKFTLIVYTTVQLFEDKAWSIDIDDYSWSNNDGYRYFRFLVCPDGRREITAIATGAKLFITNSGGLPKESETAQFTEDVYYLSSPSIGWYTIALKLPEGVTKQPKITIDTGSPTSGDFELLGMKQINPYRGCSTNLIYYLGDDFDTSKSVLTAGWSLDRGILETLKVDVAAMNGEGEITGVQTNTTHLTYKVTEDMKANFPTLLVNFTPNAIIDYGLPGDPIRTMMRYVASQDIIPMFSKDVMPVDGALLQSNDQIRYLVFTYEAPIAETIGTVLEKGTIAVVGVDHNGIEEGETIFQFGGNVVVTSGRFEFSSAPVTEKPGVIQAIYPSGVELPTFTLDVWADPDHENIADHQLSIAAGIVFGIRLEEDIWTTLKGTGSIHFFSIPPSETDTQDAGYYESLRIRWAITGDNSATLVCSQSVYLPWSDETTDEGWKKTVTGQAGEISLDSTLAPPLDTTKSVYCSLRMKSNSGDNQASATAIYSAHAVVGSETEVITLMEGIPDAKSLGQNGHIVYKLYRDAHTSNQEDVFIVAKLTSPAADGLRFTVCSGSGVNTKTCADSGETQYDLNTQNGRVLIWTQSSSSKDLYIRIEDLAQHEGTSIITIYSSAAVKIKPKFEQLVPITLFASYSHPEFINVKTTPPNTLHVLIDNIEGDDKTQLSSLTVRVCPNYPRAAEDEQCSESMIRVDSNVPQYESQMDFHIPSHIGDGVYEWWIEIIPDGFSAGEGKMDVTVVSDILLSNAVKKIIPSTDVKIGQVPLSLYIPGYIDGDYLTMSVTASVPVEFCLSSIYPHPDKINGECSQVITLDTSSEGKEVTANLTESSLDNYLFMTLSVSQSYINSGASLVVIIKPYLTRSYTFDSIQTYVDSAPFDHLYSWKIPASIDLSNVTFTFKPNCDPTSIYMSSSLVSLTMSAETLAPELDGSNDEILINEKGLIMVNLGSYLTGLPQNENTGYIAVRMVSASGYPLNENLTVEFGLHSQDDYSKFKVIGGPDVIEMHKDSTAMTGTDYFHPESYNVSSLVVTPCIGAPSLYISTKEFFPSSASNNGHYGWDNTNTAAYDRKEITIPIPVESNNYVAAEYAQGESSAGIDFSYQILDDLGVKCRPRISITDLTILDMNNVNKTNNITIGFDMALAPLSADCPTASVEDGIVFALYMLQEDNVDLKKAPGYTSCGFQRGGKPLYIDPQTNEPWIPAVSPSQQNGMTNMTIKNNQPFAWNKTLDFTIIARLVGTNYETVYEIRHVNPSDWHSLDDGLPSNWVLDNRAYVETNGMTEHYYYPELSINGMFSKKTVISVSLECSKTSRKNLGVSICVSNNKYLPEPDERIPWCEAGGSTAHLDPIGEGCTTGDVERTFILMDRADYERLAIRMYIDPRESLEGTEKLGGTILAASYIDAVEAVPAVMREDHHDDSMHMVRLTVPVASGDDVVHTLVSVVTDVDSTLIGSSIDVILCENYPPDTRDFDNLPSFCRKTITVRPTSTPDAIKTFTFDTTSAGAVYWIATVGHQMPEDHEWNITTWSDHNVEMPPLDQEMYLLKDLSLQKGHALYLRVKIPNANKNDIVGFQASATEASIKGCASLSTSHPDPSLDQCDASSTFYSQSSSPGTLHLENTVGDTYIYLTLDIGQWVTEEKEEIVLRLYMIRSIMLPNDMDVSVHLYSNLEIGYFHFSTREARQMKRDVTLTLHPPGPIGNPETDNLYYGDEPAFKFVGDPESIFGDGYRPHYTWFNPGTGVMTAPANELGDELYISWIPGPAVAGMNVDAEYTMFLSSLPENANTEISPETAIIVSDSSIPINEKRYYYWEATTNKETLVLSPCYGHPAMYIDDTEPHPDETNNDALISAPFGEEIAYTANINQNINKINFISVFSNAAGAPDSTASGVYSYEIYTGTNDKRPVISNKKLKVSNASSKGCTIEFDAASIATANGTKSDSGIKYFLYGFSVLSESSSESEHRPVRTSACGVLAYATPMAITTIGEPSPILGNGANSYSFDTTTTPDSKMELTIVARYEDPEDNTIIYDSVYSLVTVDFKDESLWWIALVVLGIIALIGIGIGIFFWVKLNKKKQAYARIVEGEDGEQQNISIDEDIVNDGMPEDNVDIDMEEILQ